jgi:hypothetical protein
MSEGWIAFGSALAGAIAGGGAALVGSIIVNRRELTRRARIRMFDEILPELVDRDNGDLGDAEPEFKALERAAAMSSRGDRRAVSNLYGLWRAAQASLEPELTQIVTAFLDDWKETAFGPHLLLLIPGRKHSARTCDLHCKLFTTGWRGGFGRARASRIDCQVALGGSADGTAGILHDPRRGPSVGGSRPLVLTRTPLKGQPDGQASCRARMLPARETDKPRNRPEGRARIAGAPRHGLAGQRMR